MKKIIILVLTCLIITPVLSTRDGHYWKDLDKLKDSDEVGDTLSVLAKMNYLNGIFVCAVVALIVTLLGQIPYQFTNKGIPDLF